MIVDLAGSERAHDSQGNEKERHKESAQINKSLLALKECIRAMQSSKPNQHIPFRTSKLTMTLKDSFIAEKQKVRVHMIACISPCHTSANHTLNTLRYAEKLKRKSSSPKTEGSTKAIAKKLSTPALNTQSEPQVQRVKAMKPVSKLSNSTADTQKSSSKYGPSTNKTLGKSKSSKYLVLSKVGESPGNNPRNLERDFKRKRDMIKAKRLKSRTSSLSISSEEELGSLINQIDHVYSDIHAKLSSFHPGHPTNPKRRRTSSFIEAPQGEPNRLYREYMYNRKGKTCFRFIYISSYSKFSCLVVLVSYIRLQVERRISQ